MMMRRTKKTTTKKRKEEEKKRSQRINSPQYLCLLDLGLELAEFACNFILEGDLDLKHRSLDVVHLGGRARLVRAHVQGRENWVFSIDKSLDLLSLLLLLLRERERRGEKEEAEEE